MVEQLYRKQQVIGSSPMVGSMSRLQYHQKKVYTSQVIFFAIILILVVVFIFTIGIKMVVNTSLNVSQLTSGKNSDQTNSVKNNDFYGNISIDSIPEATNSAKIIVSGSVTNFDLVQFYLNGEKVKEKKLSSDSFSEEIGDLKKGDNKVFLLAKSKKEKKEKQSDNYTVGYKTDKPKLEISEPSDNSKTNKQEINIVGKTDKDVTVTVNDLPVVVGSQGEFQTSVKLHDGENKIIVKALDNFGNSEEKTLTLTYQKDD
jgi:hypothetical protein